VIAVSTSVDSPVCGDPSVHRVFGREIKIAFKGTTSFLGTTPRQKWYATVHTAVNRLAGSDGENRFRQGKHSRLRIAFSLVTLQNPVDVVSVAHK
jgi:hypothetical protein